jgi:hypothetical protein
MEKDSKRVLALGIAALFSAVSLRVYEEHFLDVNAPHSETTVATPAEIKSDEPPFLTFPWR